MDQTALKLSLILLLAHLLKSGISIKDRDLL